MVKDPPEEELIITFPKSVKIEPADPFAAAAQNALLNKYVPASHRDSPDPLTAGAMTPALTSRLDASQSAYTPLLVRIEFVVENIRDGFHFVGCDPDDLRFPHAYTTHSPLPGSACALFPCIDDVHERCTWEIEITIPRTLGDIRRAARSDNDSGVNSPNGTANADQELDDIDEFSDLDMVLVCSGDLVDEAISSSDSSKKTLTFLQQNTIPAHHVSFAVGPFEKVNLSEFREVAEDDAMGAIAVEVMGYCLPGREHELRNTCMFMHKAVDFFVRDFGSYPYSSYKMCFVDDLPTPTVESASFSLCSNHLLFAEDVIDPIYDATRKLTYSLAAQWVGVNIAPKEWADLWVVIGIGYYMAGLFLKKLVGNNEYRFRLKKDAEKVCELDIGRPSLYAQGLRVPFEQSDLDFIILKAPVVLFILERRLTKATGSLVLHRTLRRIFLHATSGELPNNELCTQHFIKICEKLSHSKLDTFFAQWVFGSGYPRFEVSQRFNKKKLVIEMGIKQVQATTSPPKKLNPDGFMLEARAYQRGVVVGPIVPVYSGPMTIRIHEADGTPYEHVVNITEGYTKLDIPYNTKYKRLKRTRRQKERAAMAAGIDISMDQADDVLLYCLGDVLQSEEEIADWRIEEWSKEEEERMGQESFEWIRMDADFEWICTVTLNQPDYMFLSQLQQDRDVVAQYEAVQHFSKVRETALVSSILIRTLMDRRYYYGIRIEAAFALAKCARAELDWIGEYHLRKAFQEFYCFPGSPLPKGNDFSDFTAYFVQKAIPQAMACIKNNFGSTPLTVQKFLLDLLRYNDNSNNAATDCHYVATLMKALSQTLTTSPDNDNDAYINYDFEDREIEEAKMTALREIERHQRMDQWVPSYQNVISDTALEIKRNLVENGIIKPNFQELLAYTRESNLDKLRLKAFSCLIELGAIERAELLPYIMYVVAHDPSPYIRRSLLRVFTTGLGSLAIHGTKMLSRQSRPAPSVDEMIVEEDGAGVNARKAELARETLAGAIEALKKEIGENEIFKTTLWRAILSGDLGVLELQGLLDICQLLYEEKTSMLVILKAPKHLTCKHLGKGVLHFKWAPRPFPAGPSRPPLPAPPPPPTPSTLPPPPSTPHPSSKHTITVSQPQFTPAPQPPSTPQPLTLKLKPPSAILASLASGSPAPTTAPTTTGLAVPATPTPKPKKAKKPKETQQPKTHTPPPPPEKEKEKQKEKQKGEKKKKQKAAAPATPAPPAQGPPAPGTATPQRMVVPLKIKLKLPGKNALAAAAAAASNASGSLNSGAGNGNGSSNGTTGGG
ncbi:hypothetical protein BDZ91DRAFT_808721 [Kalaharituber pfeilii]|nr:hypothetical protein BDZ91DRAFT_808721 [Kalaharituber pfeilii]